MNAWDDLNPTRAGIAGDWHGYSAAAVRAIEYAKEQGAEAILHVGDFAFLFEDRFMRNVQQALEDAQLALAFVPGNHDDYRQLDALEAEHGTTAIPMRPNIFYLPRNYRWTWQGQRFLALGGAHSVDRPWRTPGREWWGRETITWAEAQKACDDGPTDIMICHDVPHGVRIPCIEGNPFGFPQAEIDAADCHRQLLRQVVDLVTPKMLFAGHYHCRHTDVLDGGYYQTIVHILDSDSAPVDKNVAILELPTT
ncbi:metallophosphoesterase family protein [Nocardia wallacei]|uniref:metallophosphoesterase family protein n=1 Tax=Nocardia wallacei TaxID=480035 RepID=UPI002454AF4C|nr:metallophosphoesterase [Nocardia wallacei]